MPWSEAVVGLQTQVFAAVQQLRFASWSCNGWADSLSNPVLAFALTLQLTVKMVKFCHITEMKTFSYRCISIWKIKHACKLKNYTLPWKITGLLLSSEWLRWIVAWHFLIKITSFLLLVLHPSVTPFKASEFTVSTKRKYTLLSSCPSIY